MRIKMLRQKKADLQAKAQGMLGAAQTDNRLLTADERKEFAALEQQMAEVDADLEIETRHQERERAMGGSVAVEVVRDEKEKAGFPSLGTFMQAVAQVARPDRPVVDPRLMASGAASGMSEGIPSDGGFFVQKDMSSELIKRTYSSGAIAGRVRRVPISGNSNGLKINAVDETSRANGSRWGGVQAYWTAEAGALTGTKPKFRQIELNLKKITGLLYSTDELLADASALESVALQAIPAEIAFMIEDAIANGTGAGQPLGYINSGATVTVSKEANQTATTINYQNILKMWSRMWAPSRSNAVWLINQDVEPQLFQMSLAVGTGGAPVYLPPGGASASPYATLFGRPVIPVEYAATLGTIGDIQLVDLSQYLMIDKGGVESAASMHVRFLYDEMVFRFTYRCDGQPVWNAPLTPKNGTNTLSPFVLLETRS